MCVEWQWVGHPPEVWESQSGRLEKCFTCVCSLIRLHLCVTTLEWTRTTNQSSSHSLLTGLPFRTASKIYRIANSIVCSYPAKEMKGEGVGTASLLCCCPTCTLTTCQRVLWLVIWLNFCPLLHRVLRANCVLNL